jgi:hypothetical protein
MVRPRFSNRGKTTKPAQELFAALLSTRLRPYQPPGRLKWFSLSRMREMIRAVSASLKRDHVLVISSDTASCASLSVWWRNRPTCLGPTETLTGPQPSLSPWYRSSTSAAVSKFPSLRCRRLYPLPCSARIQADQTAEFLPSHGLV